MNYNTDRPIENCDQDLLGRASFSKYLGKAIFDYNSTDGLVIGLYGGWGTGKTSIINMAISELNRLSSKEENKPLIMRFAPWNYSDKNNLISIFFKALQNTINYQDNEKLKKKVGRALLDYSSAFDALSFIPGIGIGLAAVVKSVAQAQGEKLIQKTDISRSKIQLETALLETNKKIIIVIDDIDRLTNSQIRDIFQLVKQVADFPNVIYVLAMDRDVVRNALTEVHNFDGNEYLEKIIQVPFELPELHRTKLYDIFFAKLNQIIQELPINVVLDKQHWNDVLQNCIVPYLNTLRDVNRVINTFQFRYGMMYQETSLEDMIGITTIEVLEPDLYKWIRTNKESVCGGIMHSLLSVGDGKTDYRKLYIEEFSQLRIDPEKTIKCVSAMFPVFAKDVNEQSFEYQSADEAREKMRIAQEGRFDLYFMLDLDDIKVPRSTIRSCIYDLDAESMRSIIEEINKQGNIIYYLEEVRALLDNIPYERLVVFASVLISLQEGFQGERSIGLFSLNACELANHCVQDMIHRLRTEDERYSFLYTTIKHADNKGLGAITRIIHRIELDYGRWDTNSERKEGQIILSEHLHDLEHLYIERIKDLATSESLLDINCFMLVMLLWETFDKDGAKEFITKLAKDDFSTIRFICSMAGRWNGTKGSGWSFNPNNYSSFFSDEYIYNLIQKYDKEKLDEFSSDEQVKMASFVLNYQKDEIDHVNETDALKLVEEWKHRPDQS